MNTPIPHSLSTNQVRNRVLGYTNQLSDEKNQWIQAIKDSFITNLNYTVITKNLVPTDKYDTWIYDTEKSTSTFEGKKFLSYPYETPQFDGGDYISFSYGGINTDWLITEIDLSQIYNINGKLERCSNYLRWLDNTKKLIQYPCVINPKITRFSLDQNSTMALQNAKLVVEVQGNVDTRKLKTDDRFLFNGQAFKVIYYDNYQLDNISDKNTCKSIVLYLDVDQIIPNIDDIENNIANAFGNTPTPSPTPTPTATGTAYISNTKGEIYTTSKQIKVGGSPVPFDAIFKDTTGNVVSNILPKWSLITTSDQTNKIHLTYNATYPNRAYVQVDNVVSLIGSNFSLKLVDQNDLYGACDLVLEVNSYSG